MVDRGRACPLSYRYQPEELAGPPCCSVSTLYVIGCLYGNTAALRAVLDRAHQEDPEPVLVFNGDFHYLDTAEEAFRDVAETVAAHNAIQGNIEAGLVDPSDEIGCGCAYPDYISDDTVESSNHVAGSLRRMAQRLHAFVAPLGELPRFLTVDVGGHRVGVIHGDPENLAGWRLALEAMEPGDPAVREWTHWAGTPTTPAVVNDWFRRAGVDVLACTHTGLPYAQDYELDGRRRLVINSGTAGLPDFADRRHGVMTRISTQAEIPSDSLYGTNLDGLRCDALPVYYDHEQWAADFLTTWPPGSPAHTAYSDRLLHGTHLTIEQAARGTVRPS